MLSFCQQVGRRFVIKKVCILQVSALSFQCSLNIYEFFLFSYYDLNSATGALEDEMSKTGNCISINGTPFTLPRT